MERLLLQSKCLSYCGETSPTARNELRIRARGRSFRRPQATFTRAQYGVTSVSGRVALPVQGVANHIQDYPVAISWRPRMSTRFMFLALVVCCLTVGCVDKGNSTEDSLESAPEYGQSQEESIHTTSQYLLGDNFKCKSVLLVGIPCIGFVNF